MKNFSIEKKGYKRDEVNTYALESERKIDILNENIEKLNREIVFLKNEVKSYKEKEELINHSIEVAIQAGNSIKEKNQELYHNEIKSIRELYNKWNSFLTQMKKENLGMSEIGSELILSSLSESIDKILKNKTEINLIANQSGIDLISKKTIVSNEKSGITDNFRNIIFREKRPKNETMSDDKFLKEYNAETKRLQGNSESGEIFNKNTDVAFAAEGSGFDLKEAVNPTMDLEEIMKSFDLD